MMKSQKIIGALVILALGACAVIAARTYGTTAVQAEPFRNRYVIPEDIGERVRWTYFFRRAWVQITRDLSRTDVPPTIPLDFAEMQKKEFAVAWLGHASLLLRVGDRWVLIDPVFSNTSGPVQGLGPARLTPVPFTIESLPHIDVVLISHDHYDHLDLTTVKNLAKQPGGAPAFFVGLGLSEWFYRNTGTPAREFAWWDATTLGETDFRFVPAQHNSGRTAFHKNTTLWGGWIIRHADKQFYFPGDTAFVAQLFEDIVKRVGPIDVAALPIGSYHPRELMRFEHLDPDDALHAHDLLRSKNSFGVHWGTFQLGDEEPFQPAVDLSAAIKQRQHDRDFGLMPVGGFMTIDSCVEGDFHAVGSLPPATARKSLVALQPARGSGSCSAKQ